MTNSISSLSSNSSNKVINSSSPPTSFSIHTTPPLVAPLANNSPMPKSIANVNNINSNLKQNEKISPGLAKRVTVSPQSLTSSNSTLHESQTDAATNLKLQNALDRNMQKLNLSRQTNKSNSKLKGAELTKEEIELFTKNVVQSNFTSTENHVSFNNIDLAENETKGAFHLTNLNNKK